MYSVVAGDLCCFQFECFGENTYILLLAIYLGVEFLDHGVCILLAFVDTVKIFQFTPPSVNQNSNCFFHLYTNILHNRFSLMK